MAVFQMFDFGCGSAMDPAGELIVLPRTIDGFTGSYF